MLTRKGGGFPRPYLIARMHGRRLFWRAAVEEQPLSASDPWHALQQEYAWALDTMDRPTERVFSPYFCYFELKSILVCLRLLRSGEGMKLEQVIASSRLSRPFRECLRQGGPVEKIVSRLLELLSRTMPVRPYVRPNPTEGDWSAQEELLVEHFYRWALGRRTHSLLRWFFSAQVDMRNSLRLYRALRWDLSPAPDFIPGGRVATRRLLKVYTSKDPRRFGELGPMFKEISASGSVEAAALAWQTGQLRRRARTQGELPYILDYLWSCYLQTRSRSMQKGGESISAEAAAQETVR